jgi:hypothetical protein
MAAKFIFFILFSLKKQTASSSAEVLHPNHISLHALTPLLLFLLSLTLAHATQLAAAVFTLVHVMEMV